MLSGVKRASQKSVLKIIETARPFLTQDGNRPCHFRESRSGPALADCDRNIYVIYVHFKTKGKRKSEKIKTINGPFRNVA
jgi:hypothetical protein